MSNLQIVENGIIREQEQTRIFTKELMTAFAVDPVQLNSNLDNIYRQLDNDRNGADNFALQLITTYATPDDVLIQNLNDISASLGSRTNDANIFGNSLSSAYSVDPSSLYNNLNNIAEGLDGDRYYADQLKNSLSAAFNPDSYNISGLISAINNVGDAASRAAAGIEAYNNATDNMPRFKIIDSNTGEVWADLGYADETYANTELARLREETYDNTSPVNLKIQKYSNGGIVKDIDNPVFDKIAESMGEDHLVAVKNSELIIPPEKAQEFIEKFLPTFSYQPLENLKSSIPDNIQTKNNNSVTVNMHYDNLVNVEGSVDKSFSSEFNNMVQKVSTKIKKDLYNSGKSLGMHKRY